METDDKDLMAVYRTLTIEGLVTYGLQKMWGPIDDRKIVATLLQETLEKSGLDINSPTSEQVKTYMVKLFETWMEVFRVVRKLGKWEG